jgi:hypothetical protein
MMKSALIPKIYGWDMQTAWRPYGDGVETDFHDISALTTTQTFEDTVICGRPATTVSPPWD